MHELVIAPPERKDGKESKGRIFRAVHLAHVEADSLWEGGMTDTETLRPVWIMIGGTETEVRPFVTNLILGKKARLTKDKCFELLKSAGYRYSWQRIPEKMSDGRIESKAIVTAYLPDLFQMDLGMVDPKGLSFCLLPTTEWVASSTIETTPAVEHVRKTFGKVGVPIPDEDLHLLVPVAVLFCAFLDRRTRCPIIADTRFYLQIFCAALAQGIAGWTRNVQGGWGKHGHFRLTDWSTSDVRIALVLACKSTHEELEAFLAEQVRIYFEVLNG